MNQIDPVYDPSNLAAAKRHLVRVEACSEQTVDEWIDENTRLRLSWAEAIGHNFVALAEGIGILWEKAETDVTSAVDGIVPHESVEKPDAVSTVNVTYWVIAEGI